MGSTIVAISAKNLYEGDPVAKAKIAYETALKEYQRAEGLVKDKIISAKEFEQTRMKYENARTAYEAQAANCNCFRGKSYFSHQWICQKQAGESGGIRDCRTACCYNFQEPEIATASRCFRKLFQ